VYAVVNVYSDDVVNSLKTYYVKRMESRSMFWLVCILTVLIICGLAFLPVH